MRVNSRIVAVVVAVVVVVAAAAVLLARGGVALGQSGQIGFVDMQKALDAHPRKAPSEQALNEYARAKVSEASQRAKGLTPAQQQELQRKVNEDIFNKRQELLSGLDKEIRAAVERVAKARGIAIVLEKSVVLYGGVDLTDDVIREVKGK